MSKLRSNSAALSACSCWLVFTISIASGTDATEYDATRFERTNVARDLVQPMEFDIADDGTIFLIELAGKLKTIDSATGKQTVVGELTVTTAQENGLIGLALAPDFATSGWIYLQYSPPDFSGQRISRFKFLDGKLDLQSEQQLLQYEEQRRECCHHAGSLEFGPDGSLYIGTGDNTNPFEYSDGFAPIDQREGREPWDARRTAANSNSFNGKILRIHPEADGTYSIPDGNLFPKDGSQGLPEIFVMGCRNPWRISVDQHTGYLYWGDVGPDAGSDGPRGPRGYDEVNQARQAGFFGWPLFIGNNYLYYDYDFDSKAIGAAFDPAAPINNSRNNTGITQLPAAQPAMIFYPGGLSEQFPEVASGGRTACAGPIYYAADFGDSPNRLPDSFDRTLFAFEWSRNWIMAVHLDEDSRVTSLERFMPDETFTRPIQLKFDRNGSLYVLIYGETWGVNPDAELVRIDYIRGNRKPKAQLQADRTAGREPLTVQLDGAASSDRDQDSLQYRWSYSKAATAENATISECEFSQCNKAELTLNEPGIYTLHLDVSDPSGAADRESINVMVGNEPPRVRFLQPSVGGFFQPGAKLTYELEIEDREDGTSNYAAVDDTSEMDELDPSAVARTFVQLVPVGLDGRPLNDANAPAGLKLIRQSGCLNCHATHRPLVGPAYVDVATKYRGQPDALEKSIERVQKGSTGVWGKVPMLPHAHNSVDEIRTMVEYVYTITADEKSAAVNGLRNELEVPVGVPAVRVEATYADLGNGNLPSITTSAAVLLRQRKIQAEQATSFAGTKVLNSSKAEAGAFMGAIEHAGYLEFTDIPLQDVGAIRVSVASAGAGGQIQFRIDDREGAVIGNIPVEVNGQWEEFYQREVPIADVGQTHKVFMVFINEQNRGGLMNVDWIEFLPRAAPETAGN